jgi:DNA-binding SARP family transcriptional activator
MTTMTLHMLGAFEVTALDEPSVPSSAGTQRLLAYLALQDRPVSRTMIAGALWPEASTSSGGERLRAALARLDPLARRIVDARPGNMRLDPACIVDYRDARSRAERLLETSTDATTASAAETRLTIALPCLDLLPDVYDDWALIEAEDWRIIRAVALESLVDSLSRDARPFLAMLAARAAIRNEPLRETAHAALVRLHIVEGNHGEAMRAFELFRTALAEAMDVEPSASFLALVRPLRASRSTSAA